jgi:catechol 2,3-dioxygenase-like lactoylglutathione lyase family enzyme
MPDPTAATDPRFERALAQVFVRDVPAALDFYGDTLGFEVVYAYGTPPFYAEVKRDGAAFNLRHTDRSPWDVDPDEEDVLAVAIAVTDAEPLFRDYAGKGVEMHRPLHEEHGARAFIVRDPDGNLVLFGSPLPA